MKTTSFSAKRMLSLCSLALLGMSTLTHAAVIPSAMEAPLLRQRAMYTKTVTNMVSVTQTVTVEAYTTTTTVLTLTASPTSTSSAASTIATGAPSRIILTSNDATYGQKELMADLENILNWAGDQGNVTPAQKAEIVAAILSASARYYPEMPTKAISRIMLADIRTESDFNSTMITNGINWGLLQVSPGAESMELDLFKQHANVATHNFTFGMPVDVRAGIKGPLLDYATGQQMDLASLTTDDLFRPWINIHLSMWVQSNLARTQSQDPYNWAELNAYSWSLKQGFRTNATASVATKWASLLTGANVSPTIRTGLGSWVAGPAMGTDGYTSAADTYSTTYLNTIMRSVRFLYGVSSASQMPRAWLETYPLNVGLIDYV